MKKRIIFFVVISLCFCKDVSASIFYGEYRKVNDVGNYVNDELKIEKYKLYNTYETKYIDMGYMLENDLYIKDEKDYIEDMVNVDVNENSDEYIKFQTNSNATTNIYLYNKSDFNIKIYELEVYSKDNKKGYGFIGVTTDISSLYDGNYDTYFEINPKELFGLNIYISYLIKDLKIIIYTKDENNYPIRITLRNNDFDILLNNKEHNKHIISYDGIEDIKYEYKTMKTLYRYYKEEKVKLNNYVSEGDNILLDDYIEYNDIYVRDKLVLKDELIINDKNTKVIDLIEYSTDDVDINCNINYKINGIYNCNFILNDISISKDILVDIPIEDTKIDDKKEVIEFITDNENNITKNNGSEVIEEVYEDNEITVDKNIIDSNKIVYEKENNTQDNIIQKNTVSNKENYIIKNNDTKEEKIAKKNNEKKIINTNKDNVIQLSDSKENVKNKNNKKLINIVKYIIFLNLIFIEVILFIKKRKRNNVERV